MAVALALMTAVAFLRLGPGALSGPVWAEDAGIFLQRAYDGPLWSSLLEPYAGYALVVPRLQVEVVTWLPLDAQGVALCLMAALTVATVAVLVLLVVRAHLPDQAPLAWLAALAVAAVPVGPETIGNIANGQWYLLVGATVAPLWTPRGLPGRGFVLAMMLATVLTCPFGFLPVLSAAVVWAVTRARACAGLVAVGVVGFAVQAVVIITAPPRMESPDPTVSSVLLGYLRRVLGDGVLGASRHDRMTSASVVAGLVVLAGILVLVLAVRAVRSAAALAAPAYLLVTSLVLCVTALTVSGVPTEYSYQAGRYYVAPAALMIVAVVLLTGRAWQGRHAEPSGGRARALGWAARAVGVGLVVVALGGAASSYVLSDLDSRRSYDGWTAALGVARDACADRKPRGYEAVLVSPPGWQVSVRCARLLGEPLPPSR